MVSFFYQLGNEPIAHSMMFFFFSLNCWFVTNAAGSIADAFGVFFALLAIAQL